MSTYDHDGLRLHYETVGSGPGVLCVHGASGSGAYDWAQLADALSGTHRVVIPDLRGHGKSDHRKGELALELIEEDLRALVQHEDLGNPHLIGFSFGAEVALRLALHHPDLPASLVLISPGLGTTKSVDAAKAEVPSRDRLERGWPRELRDLHTERHGPDHWVEVMQELWVRHAERVFIPLEDLAVLTCPILLIHGSSDDPRRIRQAQLFVGANANARIVEINGGAHAVHKDHPDEVHRVVADFLSEVSP
ncbi:MAG TPA: alpha/beta hydrolase [Mycobacteriales bacterium]|jgi:pimeloyl-ACP methyl ester carboxylesterase|nr:alpha/beta hydrolase [Mycobacteriales bacterium]HWA67915.1 alpha/beta hydrolase [Mycobacteriales bacterium]